MQQATGALTPELTVLRPGLDRVREKLYLAARRRTTLVEDIVYSLLGIFNVSTPVIYGEGNCAVGRFLEHILASLGDTLLGQGMWVAMTAACLLISQFTTNLCRHMFRNPIVSRLYVYPFQNLPLPWHCIITSTNLLAQPFLLVALVSPASPFQLPNSVP